MTSPRSVVSIWRTELHEVYEGGHFVTPSLDSSYGWWTDPGAVAAVVVIAESGGSSGTDANLIRRGAFVDG